MKLSRATHGPLRNLISKGVHRGFEEPTTSSVSTCMSRRLTTALIRNEGLGAMLDSTKAILNPCTSILSWVENGKPPQNVSFNGIWQPLLIRNTELMLPVPAIRSCLLHSNLSDLTVFVAFWLTTLQKKIASPRVFNPNEISSRQKRKSFAV